ncbi:hypothetical protein [Aggregatibacter sp. 2125159857]|uniref:hypothetical protein n=1 Tax=Aggregatibacter sp. 2125159857 TaxID=2820817 RepID=UPI001ADEEA98|nr:hypothetical protein [Aggregatibacter sp. 2125159857]QTO01816.1 hypothetical protein J5X96_02050 [Aggregatibacter sp. 2125159857]
MGRKSKARYQGEVLGLLVSFGIILAIIAFVISLVFSAVFYVGGAIAIAIAIGIPLFLLLSIPYYLVGMNKIKVEVKKSISDYWLSREEKEELKSLYQAWLNAKEEENRIEDKIKKLHDYADEQGVSKNIDGSYSRRSEVGKSIINSLTNLENELDLAKDYSLMCWEEYKDLASTPYYKWKADSNKLREKDKFYRKVWVSLISLIFIICIASTLYITRYNKIIAIDYINNLLNRFVSHEWFSIGKETALGLLSHQYFEFVALLFISSLVSIIFYGVANKYSISKNNRFKYSVERPSSCIDMDEIDDYERTV